MESRNAWKFGGVVAAAAAVLVAQTAITAAQDDARSKASTQPAGETRHIDPLDITGRAFDGVRLGQSPQRGDVELGASRAYSWTEQGREGDRPTKRLLLERDVSVRMGLYRFTAARAVVWIQQLGPAPDGGERRQIAVYFDRVSDAGAEAGVAQAADRLLVTGVMDGDLTLRADATFNRRPSDEFVIEAEQRMQRFLLRQIGATDFVTNRLAPARAPKAKPEPRQGLIPGESAPYQPGSGLSPTEPAPPAGEWVEPSLRQPPIFSENGIITIAKSSPAPIVLQGGQKQSTLVVTGGLTVQHVDPLRHRTLQITAQRAVVFLPPGPLSSLTRLRAGDVRGIYLEGDVVATDGAYTIRGNRVYYDVAESRATIVDAVFSTFDEQRGMPLYMRAKVIRQEAENKFSAEHATLASAAFADPMFAIGATDITVTRRKRAKGGSETYVDVRDLTLTAGGVPFFYWPRFSGNIDDVPLRDVRVENSSGSGAAVKTTWNIFGVLGVDPPKGYRADALIDGYFRRGMALGLDTGWATPTTRGGLFAYSLLHDTGTDVLTSGARIGHDGETRSMILGEHRWDIDENWSVFLEGAYVSDPTFVDAFFEPLAETRREMTNSAYLRYVSDTSAFTAQAKGSLIDFTPNEYLLESQGYTTEKLPELAYYRIADDVFSRAAPGLLTYSSELRLSGVRLNFTEPTIAELGFDTPARASAAFGLNPTDRISDRLRARGLSESTVYRVDTRHELTADIKAGPVRIDPFATGRITAYDQTFEQYSPDSNDQVRFWGAVGASVSTTVQHVDDNVDSRMFDLHRIRHVVEPSATVWVAGTNLDQTDLPVFDDRVESLASGGAVRFGVDQTWQTMRGGPGRWYSVDVLRFDQNFVFSTGDADMESPIGRFFDFRPEYSLLGDYATTDIVWQTTDAVALSFRTVYDFTSNQPAQTVVGALVRHSDLFSTYAEARFINALNTTYLNFGVDYELTRKYRLNAYATYDTDIDKFQSVGATVRRRFPEATFGLSVSYDNIANDTSIGFVFEPLGLDQQAGNRLQQLQSRPGGALSLGG